MSSQDQDQDQEYDYDNDDSGVIDLEQEFREKYAEDQTKYYALKELEKESAQRKLAKRSMPELVEKIYQREQADLLNTEAVGAVCLVMAGSNFGSFSECLVLDDNKLETTVAGRRKTVAKLHEPIQVTLNMRKYWIGGGMFWKIRYFFVWVMMRVTFMMDLGILRFNIFFMRADGEYTIDPSKDWTPFDLARKVEGWLKLEGRLGKANIRSQLMRDDDSKKQLNMIVYAFLIAMVAIIFLFTWSSG